jgi:hypothetical protein
MLARKGTTMPLKRTPMSRFAALVARCEDYSGSREPENRPAVILLLAALSLALAMALAWLAVPTP